MAIESNLGKLNKLLSLMDTETLTKEMFASSFKRVVDLVLQIQKRQVEEMKTLEAKQEEIVKIIRSEHGATLSDIRKQVDDVFVGKRLNKIDERLSGSEKKMMDTVVARLSRVRDGKSIIGPRGPLGPAGSPDLPEDVLNKLRFLKEEGLTTTDVFGLDKALEDMKEETAKVKRQPRILAGPNANAVMTEDISDQCGDGNRIFTVPRHRIARKLDSSQFPFIWRITVDFTTANTILTILNNAPTPAKGQTLYFDYVK